MSRLKRVLAEMKFGLRETSKYIFSHHEHNGLYKCYKIFGIHFCARCFGIYPGIILGLISYNYFNLDIFVWYLILAVFPLGALIDWSYTTFAKVKGYNWIRTLSGFMLGFSYSIGLSILYENVFFDIVVYLIGLIYVLITVGLIYIKKNSIID